MQRVTGIGGLFSRAADPVALGRWYADPGRAPKGDGIQHWQPIGADADGPAPGVAGRADGA